MFMVNFNEAVIEILIAKCLMIMHISSNEDTLFIGEYNCRIRSQLFNVEMICQGIDV